MTDKQIPITVVVPVKNEEKNLPNCLKRLRRFTEVIVVDSGSTDRTPEITCEQGASLVNFEWDGRYPKKRNWMLLTHAFTTEWVLFLDADEFVNDAFCNAVDRAISTKTHSGYWLNYSNYFLGRELKYGVPQRKLALIKLGSGLYERIDEDAWSQLDMEIHEHPIIEGTIGEIAERIDHRDFQGTTKFIDRHRDYAVWEANRILLLEKEPEKKAHLTNRQRFKYTNVERWWYPWFYFLYSYVVKLGFLDASAGFYYSFYKAWYFLSIRLIVRELRESEATEDVMLRGVAQQPGSAAFEPASSSQ